MAENDEGIYIEEIYSEDDEEVRTMKVENDEDINIEEIYSDDDEEVREPKSKPKPTRPSQPKQQQHQKESSSPKTPISNTNRQQDADSAELQKKAFNRSERTTE